MAKPDVSGSMLDMDVLQTFTTETIKTKKASQQAAAAALAGGMIAASGRPHSLKEAMDLFANVQCAMFPNPTTDRYQAWAKDPQRLTRVYK